MFNKYCQRLVQDHIFFDLQALRTNVSMALAEKPECPTCEHIFIEKGPVKMLQSASTFQDENGSMAHGARKIRVGTSEDCQSIGFRGGECRTEDPIEISIREELNIL